MPAMYCHVEIRAPLGDRCRARARARPPSGTPARSTLSGVAGDVERLRSTRSSRSSASASGARRRSSCGRSPSDRGARRCRATPSRAGSRSRTPSSREPSPSSRRRRRARTSARRTRDTARARRRTASRSSRSSRGRAARAADAPTSATTSVGLWRSGRRPDRERRPDLLMVQLRDHRRDAGLVLDLRDLGAHRRERLRAGAHRPPLRPCTRHRSRRSAARREPGFQSRFAET